MKMMLNCHDQFDRVWSMTKTRQDNDEIDHTGSVYVEIKTKLSCPIQQGTINDEEKTTT